MTSRRVILATGCAGLLAGCQVYGAEGEPDEPPAAPGPTGSAAGTASGQPAKAALAKVADIPVGGGKVFAEQKVVLTQPTAGVIKAFSATCTHQGCVVADVSNGTINCPCHGSAFKVADGSVANGPATRALKSVTVTVADGAIKLGA